MIKKNISFTEIHIPTKLPSLTITVNLPNKITISNIYIKHETKVLFNDLNLLIEATSGPLVFLGDFNAHNPLWGSADRNQKGQKRG